MPCADAVHPGHIRHLMYASGKADILVASITADEFIEKANFRPYVPEELRAINLAALDMVDYVVIDSNPTPLENLSTIKPDYFAKGTNMWPRPASQDTGRKGRSGHIWWGIHLYPRRHCLLLFTNH